MSAKSSAIRETVDAKKSVVDGKAALALLRSAETVHVAKGARVVTFRMKSAPPSDDDLAVAIGPTGNLRAPTMRVGKVMIVGFSEAVLDEVLD